MKLVPAASLAEKVAAILRPLSAQLARLLPFAEFHHVGATAIPDALTKGDLDVLLRVDASHFASASDVLTANFEIRQPENWTPFFASFGDDQTYTLPLGVQLVAKDSEADFFLFVHDHFLAHPAALADYNRAKAESAGGNADAYWSAKNRILTPIIALKSNSNRSG